MVVCFGDKMPNILFLVDRLLPSRSALTPLLTLAQPRPQPNDSGLFAPKHLPALTSATDDLCWLLGRGYGIDSSLQLVGTITPTKSSSPCPTLRSSSPPTAGFSTTAETGVTWGESCWRGKRCGPSNR